MDKDNEIYVTSNGELYKKGVEQAIYPQTNYTTQQFYTKEEYDKLQAENERLKKQYNCYACDSCGGKEDYINMKRHTENAIKTVHKYSQSLQEIREMAEKEIVCDNCNFEGTDKCDARMCTHFYLNDFSKDILDKINKVIGAEE